MCRLIKKRSLAGASKAVQDFAKTLLKLAKSFDTEVVIETSGKVLASVSPTDEFEYESRTARGTTTIYGELLRVGGEDPVAHVRDESTWKIVDCRVNRADAQRLGKRLYSVVGLKGDAVWNFETDELIAFEVTRVLDFRDPRPTEAMKALSEILEPSWGDVEDPTVEIMRMRRGDDS